MLTAVRKMLVENAGERTCYEWGALGIIGPTAARRYLDYMVDHDEAATTIIQQPHRQIRRYGAIS